ncbi:ribonuclease R [Ferruginivarius sediminum]|uniref:ribonuclease R n=1 Tax=Ferruginivarius sediminum TaxID=2661937 RepID=UPI0019D48DDD|nr:ribonuclease R [Ferruginivarius sediminum]
MARATRKAGPLPSRDELLRYIEESAQPVDKRDIARAFHLKGAQRVQLKEMLRELLAAGDIEQGEKKRLRPVNALPEISVLDIADRDPDGELLARPAQWKGETSPPRIYVVPERGWAATLHTGARILAKLSRIEPGVYEARPIRVLAGSPKRVLGIYERGERAGRLRPTDKRVKQEYILRKEDAAGAEPGEFVLCEVKPHHPRLGQREVRVVERLGDTASPKAISLIAIHENDIPVEFPEKALEAANEALPVRLGDREDLRELPLVTIDGTDARDFDDAVMAAPDDGDDNPGGFRIMVAIADVAHYVRPDGALDRAARDRGNSVYFPDRVVPMLPEGLSNGWCSLRPDEDRGCMAVEIRIGRDGKALEHRFMRGLMRSSARLTYEQVQAARDGNPDALTAPLLEPVIEPLYGAFEALLRAREARGTLDIDIAEKQVIVDETGNVKAIEPRERLDSHRLIEEFMIAANVAAAETLESRGQPCMYRVHEPPDPDKVDALRETLRSFDLTLASDQAARPEAFKRILAKVAGHPEAAMVNQLVLRCQSQAYYSPDNQGHFGLALQRYAHFTSPIRRYADLLVHRALIDGLKLGEGGLGPGEAEAFAEIGEHISFTERRAQGAEYDAIDRFTAAYLKDRVGTELLGRVGGVTRFGLFVTLQETGADGLIPIGTLPNDFYRHDEKAHCLVGNRWGRVYRLGDKVKVRLAEADPVTGGIVLEMIEVIESAGGESIETEPVSPGGPGKGRRRQAARTSKTARKSARKAKQAKKAAKAGKSTKPAGKASSRNGHASKQKQGE